MCDCHWADFLNTTPFPQFFCKGLLCRYLWKSDEPFIGRKYITKKQIGRRTNGRTSSLNKAFFFLLCKKGLMTFPSNISVNMTHKKSITEKSCLLHESMNWVRIFQPVHEEQFSRKVLHISVLKMRAALPRFLSYHSPVKGDVSQIWTLHLLQVEVMYGN
jgi:hypothetical protein